MAVAEPTEYLPGDSGARWFLGNWALLAVSYGTGLLLGDVLVPPGAGSRLVLLAVQLALMSAISVPANLLYFLAVPCPRNLTARPEGIEVDFGLRRKRYPWRDLHLRRGDAYLFGGWGGIPARVHLNAYQRMRVEAWLAMYAPPPPPPLDGPPIFPRTSPKY